MKCSQTRPGFELMSPCPFPTTITITPRASLLNIQHYKVRIKDKWSNPEKGVAPSPTPQWAFKSLLTMLSQLALLTVLQG